MLYHLVDYLKDYFDFPGVAMFQALTFRSAMAIIFSLLLAILVGGKIIKILRRKQIGEDIRELGLEGQMQKKGTPTMGGIIILAAVLVPILLFGDLSNVYVQLMIVSTIWLGTIGFIDDYIKVFRKRKDGLNGRFKIVGQVGLGVIVGTVMCASSDIVVKEKIPQNTGNAEVVEVIENGLKHDVYLGEAQKATKTTIPFVKNNEFNYHWLVPMEGSTGDVLTWIIYVFAAIFIITAVSNGANLTDGLDG